METIAEKIVDVGVAVGAIEMNCRLAGRIPFQKNGEKPAQMIHLGVGHDLIAHPQTSTRASLLERLVSKLIRRHASNVSYLRTGCQGVLCRIELAGDWVDLRARPGTRLGRGLAGMSAEWGLDEPFVGGDNSLVWVSPGWEPVASVL